MKRCTFGRELYETVYTSMQKPVFIPSVLGSAQLLPSIVASAQRRSIFDNELLG